MDEVNAEIVPDVGFADSKFLEDSTDTSRDDGPMYVQKQCESILSQSKCSEGLLTKIWRRLKTIQYETEDHFGKNLWGVGTASILLQPKLNEYTRQELKISLQCPIAASFCSQSKSNGYSRQQLDILPHAICNPSCRHLQLITSIKRLHEKEVSYLGMDSSAES